VCVSVCVSAAVCPHYCTDPDVTWGRGRGCPLVVRYWADLQSAHGLRCLWQHNVNPSLRGVFARCLLVTGGWRRRSQHYCGGLDCGFQWWRSGDITRTQNVSEYVLVSSLNAWLIVVFGSVRLFALIYPSKCLSDEFEVFSRQIFRDGVKKIYNVGLKTWPTPHLCANSGRVIAERVNIVQTRHKVFPILGEAWASSPSNLSPVFFTYQNVTGRVWWVFGSHVTWYTGI